VRLGQEDLQEILVHRDPKDNKELLVHKVLQVYRDQRGHKDQLDYKVL
jgi:hypothetical protein